MTLILIITTVVISFLVKGIVGFGGPLLAVPVLAPVLGVEHAVVVVSLGNIVSNLMLLWGNREGAATVKDVLVRMIPAGALGAVAGTYLLTTLDDRLLQGAVAVTVFAYIGVALVRPDLHLSRDRGLRLAGPVGTVGGFMHGTTGNSGPVFGTFLHSLDLNRRSFVFAVTIPFLAFGSIQVATLATLGAFTSDRMAQAAAVIVTVVVVTPVGSRLAGRLRSETFSRLVLALLLVAGVSLLVAVVRG